MSRYCKGYIISNIVTHYHTTGLYNNRQYPYFFQYDFYIEAGPPGSNRIRKIVVHSPNAIEAYISLLDSGFKTVKFSEDDSNTQGTI